MEPFAKINARFQLPCRDTFVVTLRKYLINRNQFFIWGPLDLKCEDSEGQVQYKTAKDDDKRAQDALHSHIDSIYL